VSRGNPYSAEMLSPSTTMTGFSTGAACKASGPQLASATSAAAASLVARLISRRRERLVRSVQGRSNTFERCVFMQEKDDPIIEVRGLCKKVVDATGELTILDHVDLSIARGASVAIVGASGSGKSTLLGLLAGLDNATAGSVRLLGQTLTTLDEDARAALRKGSIGFVFQSFQLMPHLTALENVRLPLELLGAMVSQEATARAQALLDQVGLGTRTHHYPKQLSGGEQQRVALARAFATRPAVLFADEPTGSLDAATGHAVIDLMFDLNAQHGATLVLVTHDMELARRCARVVTIDAGRITSS
jgi:putative ABC transport system ATP-binding protein